MPFRPFQETQLSLGNLQEEINRLFGRIWHAGVSTGPFDGQRWAPLIDLCEHADCYTLYAEVPGMEGEAVELSYVEHTLTIRGEKAKSACEVDADRPLRSERRFGTFCRAVELPTDIDADKLTAKCHAGVLEITIPKSETSRAKVVDIAVEQG